MAQTFYRQGVDIYNASNNQKISETDWAKNWTGRAQEVTAPQSGRFSLNLNYDPNNPNVNRYVPVTTGSTPATVGIGGGTPIAQSQPKTEPKVEVIDPFANQKVNVSVIEPPKQSPSVQVIGTDTPSGQIQGGSGQTQPMAPNASPQAPQRQFYRIGQSIFDATTNKAITPDDWAKNWTGRATEVKKGYEQIPNVEAMKNYTGFQKIGGKMFGIPKTAPSGIMDSGSALEVNPEDETIRNLLEYAGQAGMSVADTMTLLSYYSQVSGEERDKIEKELGIPDVVSSLYAKPSKTSEQLYQEAYNSSELPSIKSKIAEIDGKIAEKRNQITQGIADLQNNPWLSQASRGGRINNLKNTAEAELNNLLDQRAQYLDTYNQGVDEVEKVMLRYASQLEADQTLNASKLNYLLNQAEKQVTGLAQERQTKNLRYVPDYLREMANNNINSMSFEATKQQLELQKLGLDITNAERKQYGGELVKINGKDYLKNEDGTYSIPDVPSEALRASEIKDNALSSAKALLAKFDAGQGTSAVGTSRLLGLQMIPGQAPKDFEVLFDNLKALLSLDNASLLKGQGQISDGERKMLADASSVINLSQSEGDFRNSLANIVQALSGVSPKLLEDGGQLGYSEQEIKEAVEQMGATAVTEMFESKKKTSSAVSKIALIPDGASGGQCGAFVNKYTGLGVGDSYASKMSKMDPSIKRPEPGMVFVMPYKDSGHIGFVVGIDGDQAIVKDSNWGLDEKIKTRKVPISKMTGFARV